LWCHSILQRQTREGLAYLLWGYGPRALISCRGRDRRNGRAGSVGAAKGCPLIGCASRPHEVAAASCFDASESRREQFVRPPAARTARPANAASRADGSHVQPAGLVHARPEAWPRPRHRGAGSRLYSGVKSPNRFHGFPRLHSGDQTRKDEAFVVDSAPASSSTSMPWKRSGRPSSPTSRVATALTKFQLLTSPSRPLACPEHGARRFTTRMVESR
jgi:hypothetical protein